MEERTIHKAYKFRLYPNERQRAFMWETFGCCRFVYNHFLAVRIEAYEQKRGFEALDDCLEGDSAGLSATIADEAEHFAAIHDQRPDRRARDLRLLRDYKPGVYAAYWLWAEGEGLAVRGVKVPSRFDMSKMLTALKKVTLDEEGAAWLNAADSVALVYELQNLDSAFAQFFRRAKEGRGKAGFPRFKSRNDDRQSYKTTAKNLKVDYENGRIMLPKAGWVRCVLHREVEGRPISATVSVDSVGRWWVSIACDGVVPPEHVPTGREVAAEVGVAHSVVTSDGVVYDKGRSYERLERQLAFQQQRLSRMVGAKKGEAPSKRYRKQARRVAKLHARIAGARQDALHNISRDLVDGADVIVVRDGDVSGMLAKQGENREVPREVEAKIHRSIADAGMGELARQIKYKADWAGCDVVVVPGDYPSTQRCSACGFVNGELGGVKGLRIREWTCPECGTRHDREINSASNLLEEGRRLRENL